MFNELSEFFGYRWKSIKGERMKCRACGKELRAGSKKCPYCGADLSITGMHASNEFQWNVQDFPEPGQKKKTDFTVDWSSRKILERNSGKMYIQSENIWKEPEEQKEPEGDAQKIHFDRKQESSQRKSDRQVESAAKSKPQTKKKSPSSTDFFVLPSQMEMEDLTLIQPEEKKFAQETPAPEHDSRDEIREDRSNAVPEAGNIGEKVTPPESSIEEPAVKPVSDPPETSSGKTSQQMARFFSDTMELQREMFVDDATEEIGHEAVKPRSIFEKLEFDAALDVKPVELNPGDTPEEESTAKAEFKKLIDSEKNLTENLDHTAYLSVQEEEEERKAERRRDELQSVPEFSFRSLEDEYEKYRRDHGIEKMPGLRHNAASSNDDAVKKDSPVDITETSADSAPSREMEISDSVEAGVTRPVDLDQSGATEYHPVEMMDDSDAAMAQETVEDPELEGVEITDDDRSAADSFWSQTGTTSRMTITDIFGPEAQKFKEEWEKNSDSDLEDSIILDIHPEDIALTDDQSQAIHTVSPEDVPEDAFDQRHTIPFSKEDMLRISEVVEASEDETAETEESKADLPEEAAGNADIPETIADEAPETDETESEDKSRTEAAAEAEEESGKSGTAEAEAESVQEEAAESVQAEEETVEEEAEIPAPETVEGKVEIDETEAAGTETVQGEKESIEAEAVDTEENSDEADTAEAEAETEEAVVDAESDASDKETGDSELEETPEAPAEPAESEESAESSSPSTKQYEDLTTMLPVDEIRQSEEETDTASDHPAYEFVYEDHEKTAESLPSEPAEEGLDQAAETANEEKKTAAEKLKEFIAAKRDERNARREQKEKTPQDRTSFIMRVIIAILVALVIIEFTVIGIKVLAPDSQAYIFLNRIESAVLFHDNSLSQIDAPAVAAGEVIYE